MGARSQLKQIDQEAREVVAHNLKRVRANYANLSDREFFKMLPVPRSTIRHVMSASIGVSVDTLAGIAAGVGLPMWMLLVPDVDPTNPPSLTYHIRNLPGAAAPPPRRKTQRA